MYQFSTFLPLAASKTYVKSPKECVRIVQKAVKATNKFRNEKGQRLLSDSEIESGVRLLRLDPSQLDAIEKILGAPQEVSTENLAKAQKYL